MNTELKPCPFCGGSAELHIETAFDATGLYTTENYYHFCCIRCLARSGKYPNKQLAVENWNRRTAE